MSKPIDNGGPAFPVSTSDPNAPAQNGYTTEQFPGMTLRDWFAGQALAGMAIDFGKNGEESEGVNEISYAFAAYMLADAMLAARNAHKEPRS